MIHFKQLTDAEISFSTMRIDDKMLIEAKRRGFDQSTNPYNKLFNTLFYRGGKITYKSDVSKERQELGSRYLMALMRSFSPRHEDKEAVCAYILSELAVAE